MDSVNVKSNKYKVVSVLAVVIIVALAVVITAVMINMPDNSPEREILNQDLNAMHLATKGTVFSEADLFNENSFVEEMNHYLIDRLQFHKENDTYVGGTDPWGNPYELRFEKNETEGQPDEYWVAVLSKGAHDGNGFIYEAEKEDHQKTINKTYEDYDYIEVMGYTGINKPIAALEDTNSGIDAETLLYKIIGA